MKYINVRTAAKNWNLTEQRVTLLCRNGRIPGVLKQSGVWYIPTNAQNPGDARHNKKIIPIIKTPRLPLPIGISNYIELVENYYYVDKTLMIKEFLDERPKVSLFTRPRRFGKTLAMDMFKTFFEISEIDNSKYFKDKNIWNCGSKYQNEFGKYPVISVTFKDIKYSTWEDAFEAIRDTIANEYHRHIYLLDSDKCSEYDKKYFRSVMEKDITPVGLTSAFKNLSYMLKTHHNQASIVIIDEYDTPIQKGYSEGYYQQMVDFIRNLLSGVLKDNPNLAFGFMTGILRVAKESIFSGLNNLTIHSILDTKYSKFFGFTIEEIKALCSYYGMEANYKELCDWYNGYYFGNNDIFNPWSVLNYFYNDCTAKAYWQSTGDNSIIRQIVSESDDETAENLRKLLQKESISTYIDTSVIYPEIKNNPTTIYSFLLAAGYLKTIKKDFLPDGNFICDIAIPNKEILYVYEKEILSALSNMISQPTAIAVQQAIIKGNEQQLQEQLQKLLLNSISSFDYAYENFYQGFMLGICALMNNLYHVDSNRESGHGRYDIQMKPFQKNMPGILIELKVLKIDVNKENLDTELEKFADTALKQIDSKQYVTLMKNEGISKFIKIGIAFYKKNVKLKSKME